MICSQLLMISDCFHIMLKKMSKTRKELFYTLSIQDHNMKTIKNSTVQEGFRQQDVQSKMTNNWKTLAMQTDL